MSLKHAEWLGLHELTACIHRSESADELARLLSEDGPGILAADTVVWDETRGNQPLNPGIPVAGGERMSSIVYAAADFGMVLTASAGRRFPRQSWLKFDLLLPHVRISGRRVLFHARASRLLRRCPGEVRLADLTKRERDMLPLLLRGKSDPEVGLILGISRRTAEKHTSSLLEKLSVENRKILISLSEPL